MRTQAEWNVLTHIALTTGPTSASTRWRISCAALLVKVIARIDDGGAPSWMRCAMREHPRLARAGAGDDQQRAATVHDRVELIGVERVEFERVRHARSSVRRGCRRVDPAARSPYGEGSPTTTRSPSVRSMRSAAL